MQPDAATHDNSRRSARVHTLELLNGLQQRVVPSLRAQLKVSASIDECMHIGLVARSIKAVRLAVLGVVSFCSYCYDRR